jgi:membrane-associated protease RseP (regulator of RpoE activity)
VTGGPLYTTVQMGYTAEQTVEAIVRLPERVWGVARAIVGLEDRDPESPVSIVGGSRIAGETVSVDWLPTDAKITFLLLLIAGFNFFIGAFNFIPLLPLDGGHIASALWEAVRRGFARLRGRPDPGFVDAAKLLPIAYVMASVMLVMSVVLIVGDFVVPIHITG